jgi:hypothetical protein
MGGTVACMVITRIMYILVGRPEEKRPLGGPWT